MFSYIKIVQHSICNVHRTKRYKRKYQSGQGLVEYALILVLVAVVSVIAAFLIGLAVQRIYGLVTGALGSNVSADHNGKYIVIEVARCFVVQSSNQTGLWVTGYSNEDVNNLTGSSDTFVGTGMDGLAAPVQVNGSIPNFKFNPLLSGTEANTSLCPTTIVIQSNSGAIATSPITVVTVP